MRIAMLRLLIITYFCLVTSLLAAAEKNGFDLNNSLIPADKILHGGPPRDGIPAIDNPKFVSVNDATFVNDEDRVIGIDFQGITRAYPIKILNWHEIVNDNIANQSVVVTYCPLCGTGIVYSGQIKGNAYQFGVSGLLYNSDVLLYDQQTESLWSQILSKAISGKMAGEKLQLIPSQHTSWASWKEKHPNTQVLSTDTGFKRNYKESPYSGYEQNESVYFPLDAKSRRYHPKERVIGIEINKQFKAYPFAELAKLEKPFHKDNFAGQELQIKFDIENRDGQVFDSHGKQLPVVNSFWFAWYAFHPQTAVFTVN